MSATFHIQCSSNVMMKSFDKGWDHQLYIEKLADAMQHNAKAFKQISWALIDDIRNWPIRMPNEITLSTQVSLTMFNLGMTHCVVCVDDIAVSKWMMEKIVPNGVELAFFKHVNECKTWLADHGFDTDFDQAKLQNDAIKA